MGRWLVLGGTRFLSRAVALAALRRGHEVVGAARGRSGSVPDGARLIPVDRDAPTALAPLGGESFDAVVDVARMSLPWVRAALAALGARTGHWTFVSTVNVYADSATPGNGTDAALVPPLDTATADDPEAYGGVKVASEQAVRAAVGDRALVLRAGLLAGPGDLSDRFGYWPNAIARGGRVAVPDAFDQPMQLLDVRDLAEFVVTAGEHATTGTFDSSGPASTLGEILRAVATAVGPPDVELVPIAPEVLDAAGVARWAGPRSLPLWLPASHTGIGARDTAPIAAAGLRTRPIGETAIDTLAHERTLGVDRARGAGLTSAENAELLAL